MSVVLSPHTFWRSHTGDSSRLSGGHVIWQQSIGGVPTVLAHRLGDSEMAVVEHDATHPSALWPWVVWSRVTDGVSVVAATNMNSGKSTDPLGRGILPVILNDRCAYLRPAAGTYDLVVQSVTGGELILEILGVGFPIGSGPVLAPGAVMFETRSEERPNSIHVASIPGATSRVPTA